MHEHLLWTNDNIQYLFHGNIMEYDMVSASINISRRFNLLDDALINQLNLLPKKERTRRVGLIQRDDKDYSDKLLKGILNIRKTFLEQNNLSESNVVALHSDAVFFNSKNVINPIADGVEFKQKGQWTAYMRFKNIEMLYNNGCVTFKNINKDMLNLHTLGIVQYVTKIFNMIEEYDEDIFRYISKFQSQYLKNKLPDYYYIPFCKPAESYKTYNLQLFAFIANVVLQETRNW